MRTDSATLDVTVRGPGEPELAVVGGIHGDETGGVRAVRRLREADLDLQRAVMFVLANPEAIAAETRYVTADLNRVFPGDPQGNYEQRLAAELCGLIEDTITLSLHGTHAEETPFALIQQNRPREADIASQLPVPRIVEYSGVHYGTITQCGTTIEIEVGAQGSDRAAAEAERQAMAFLQILGALPGEVSTLASVPYRLGEPIVKPPGETYEVCVQNFEYVPAGTPIARVDGREIALEEATYPILLSAAGYPDILGYRGERRGG